MLTGLDTLSVKRMPDGSLRASTSMHREPKDRPSTKWPGKYRRWNCNVRRSDLSDDDNAQVNKLMEQNKPSYLDDAFYGWVFFKDSDGNWFPSKF